MDGLDFEIVNRGERIATTDYWASPRARAGETFLSGAGNTLRLLVPPAIETKLLDEIRLAKTVRVGRHPDNCERIELLFFDGSLLPFVVTLTERQVDCHLVPGAAATLAVYGRSGERMRLAAVIDQLPGADRASKARR